MNQSLPAKVFHDLAKFDSCSIANAVDSFRVRLLNEGFSGPGITCRTKILAPMVGVAVTLKVRSSDPSIKPAFYLEQPDWWERIEEAPFPRVLVIEDTDAHPGRGSLVGPVHACIIQAMGFVGVVTTGAVRGTRKFAEIGLHAFSGNVSPSHAYCHVVEMGGPVTVAGVQDQHRRDHPRRPGRHREHPGGPGREDPGRREEVHGARAHCVRVLRPPANSPARS